MELPRVRVHVGWIALFVDRARGSLERTFLRNVWRTEARYELATDASPWGFGAWLADFGWACAYLHGAWTDDDCKLFGLEIGSCKGQALWEALTILVAIAYPVTLVWPHVPGKTHVWADALSRLCEPGSDAVVPRALATMRATPVERRGPEWYLTGLPSGGVEPEVDGLSP